MCSRAPRSSFRLQHSLFDIPRPLSRPLCAPLTLGSPLVLVSLRMYDPKDVTCVRRREDTRSPLGDGGWEMDRSRTRHNASLFGG